MSAEEDPMISSLKLYKLLTEHVGALNHTAVQLRDEAVDKADALPRIKERLANLLAALQDAEKQ